MQFNIPLDTGRIDIAALERQLQALDPAALADLDALNGRLRISTSLDEHDIAASLSGIGHPVDAANIEREPSTCCGGCGG